MAHPSSEPFRDESANPPIDGEGGPLYAELIRESLAQERDRKDSLERRGASLIPLAGLMATVIFALTSFSTVALQPLSATDKAVVACAAAAFIVTALFGILVNQTMEYHEPTADSLERSVQEKFWTRQASIADQQLALTRVRMLRAARANNDQKEKLFQMGLLSAIVGIVFTAVAIAVLFIF
jgi:hypothetical protein